MVLNWILLCPPPPLPIPETFGRHFRVVANWRGGVLLVFSVYRPGIVLNVLFMHRTAPPPQESQAPSIDTAAPEK